MALIDEETTRHWAGKVLCFLLVIVGQIVFWALAISGMPKFRGRRY
jgi:ABC-type transporter Mla subunit MlaD